MKLTEDFEKDTVSNFFCIKNIEPIEEAEDLYGTERVEDMWVVPHVPPEPTCTATFQEDTNPNHSRNIALSEIRIKPRVPSQQS